MLSASLDRREAYCEANKYRFRSSSLSPPNSSDESDNNNSDTEASDNELETLPPPLPLLSFIGDSEREVVLPKTLQGCGIHSITHQSKYNDQGDKLANP